MFEMHLFSGIIDGWQGCEPQSSGQAKFETGPLLKLYFGSYYSFVFSIFLLLFVFFGVFSGDFGLLYSRAILDLLLFLNYFLSVSQWDPFSKVSLCVKPPVTSLHLIKARWYCR